jgi:hypothetical protein
MLQEYIKAVLLKDDAYQNYTAVYDRLMGETLARYLERCATLDYDDGEYQGAIYQDIYDRLNVQVSQ